jgi:iron(III) transport system permease protein
MPTFRSAWPVWMASAVLVAMAVPLVSIVVSWGALDAAGWAVLRAMAQTVLPGYVSTTVWLMAGVALGVVVVGTVTAGLVTLFEFPGRRVWEWLLLLPLAVPAYVVAYAYTDFLQFSGPLQTLMRAQFGLDGRVFPEVRNLGGAMVVFTFTLYPYVYLLARSALGERMAHLMEAARLLGAPLRTRLLRVALPLARPAVAAGAALALMEVLADFGVASYFGIQTFTAGIYKAWLVLDDRLAASQLATVLLAVVLAVLWVEQRAQARMRFATGRGGGGRDSPEARPVALTGGRAALAWMACGLPVLLGFVLPVLFMLRPLLASDVAVPWALFGEWVLHSVRLGGVTAAIAVGVGLLLAFQARTGRSAWTQWAVRVVGLGYAVPGAVIVVGLLVPVGWVQAQWPQSRVGYWITATLLGLVWAYTVRFGSVALQSLQSGYARIPVSLDDSARMLGVVGYGVLRRVHWPLLKRPLLAAALLVWVDVMKELPATLVLRPFNSDTLAVVAYQLARDERLGEAALPALTLVLVGLIPVILLSRAMRRESVP